MFNKKKRTIVLGSLLFATLWAIFSTVGCGDSTSTLQSIAVTPSPASGTVDGDPIAFTATGTYSDGSSSTNIAGLTWSSSDTNVATIDPTSGVANCVGGNVMTPVTITATAPSVAGGSIMVTGTSQLTCAVIV